MKQFINISVLISLFFSSSLSAQTLKEFDLQEISEQQIPLFVDHPNEAAYIFYTAINGLTVVSSTGGVVSSQQEATKLTVFLRPERQVLTIKAPGFIEKKIAVESVSAKQAKFFRLNPKETTYVPSVGSYQVSTVPEGCLLKIEGIPSFRQITPFELVNYEAKKYRINLTKPDYYNLDTLIEIRQGIRQSGVFKMRSLYGTLSVKGPEKITIKINNDPYEISTDFVNLQLRDGSYAVEVNDVRYDPYRETIKLGSGENKVLNLPLIKRVGFLKINYADALEVKINETAYQKKAGIQMLEFFEGKYKASIKREGFQPVDFSFTIKKGDIINWEPVFQPVLVKVNLQSEPNGATVYLIRNNEQQVLGFTPIEEQIEAGEVEFLFKKEGIPDYKFKVKLEEGNAVNKKINLSDKESSDQINVDQSTEGTSEVEQLKTNENKVGGIFVGVQWPIINNISIDNNYRNDAGAVGFRINSEYLLTNYIGVGVGVNYIPIYYGWNIIDVFGTVACHFQFVRNIEINGELSLGNSFHSETYSEDYNGGFSLTMSCGASIRLIDNLSAVVSYSYILIPLKYDVIKTEYISGKYVTKNVTADHELEIKQIYFGVNYMF